MKRKNKIVKNKIFNTLLNVMNNTTLIANLRVDIYKDLGHVSYSDILKLDNFMDYMLIDFIFEYMIENEVEAKTLVNEIYLEIEAEYAFKSEDKLQKLISMFIHTCFVVDKNKAAFNYYKTLK